MLYATTDLATIEMRVQQIIPTSSSTCIDKRQSLHMLQVFRCAWKTGIAPRSLAMEHVGFGTMNGPDGKPFKTREGGVLKLNDLIEMTPDKARERLHEADVAARPAGRERNSRTSPRKVGVAALKFADL